MRTASRGGRGSPADVREPPQSLQLLLREHLSRQRDPPPSGQDPQISRLLSSIRPIFGEYYGDPEPPPPPPQPAAPAPAPAAAPSAFVATVPAAATTAWLVRERFIVWLTALGWPALAVEDIVFALSEAVSNCTEHAYPPDTPDAVIEISAVIEPAPAGDARSDATARPDLEDEQQSAQRLRIRVRDHGTWRPVPPDPSHRGRGLQMMIALMNDVVIHHSDTGRPGTEVTLISPTVIPEVGASLGQRQR